MNGRRRKRALALLFLLIPGVILRAGHVEPLPVNPGDTACILLEAEPAAKPNVAAPQGLQVRCGELVAHDATRAFVHGNTLVLRKDGYVHASATLRYRLPDDVQAGVYSVWTCFTLGGVATQRFTFRAGSTPETLRERAVFSQSNVVSWKTEWRKAGQTLKIYPGDKWLEVTVAGMATQQKNLDAFLLAFTAGLPANLTLESGRRRALVDSFGAADPEYRVYVLESDDARDADPFFRYLAANSRSLGTRIVVTTFLGQESADFARDLRLAKLPAMLVMGDHYALRGVLNGAVDDARVSAFMAATMTVGPAPGPFPQRAAPAPEQPRPLRNGSPRAWLVVDGWGGPAGLSLWGIGNESRVRPNPGDACLAVYFDRMAPTAWAARQATDTGTVIINPDTADCSWPKGVGYAHIYLDSDRDVDCVLHTAQTGISTHAWLDGQPLVFAADPSPPSAFVREQEAEASIAAGVNDQGGRVRVTLGRRESPRTARLKLRRGRHRLLLKLVMQHRKGEVFSFAAQFTDASGKPLTGVRTCLSDPLAAHDLRHDALRLQPLMYVEAPSNLPRPGDRLKVRFDLRRQRPSPREQTVMPIIPFDARLMVTVTDYDGREIDRREVEAQFPGVVTMDFGTAPAAGYYALHATLYDPVGRIILVCPSDGFSVIRGTVAQAARRNRKKMAVTYYFMAGGDKYRTVYFPWMTRLGIYRNIGSNPGFPLPLAKAAGKAGITLTMDFWDIHSVYTQQKRNELAKQAAPYTRWFKSFNEVDIVPRVRRTPEHWVNRVKGEYEAAKAARRDAFYVGGSLVRPASDDWFTQCLRLGLDKYQDAWDVHAYPQRPPVLGGTLSNSPNETERGVLTCYRRVGRTNTKPFWIGETGARAGHGCDGRRWQADTIVKMVACVCSRSDFQTVGFLIPWQYSREGKSWRMNDIEAGHMPGEAAYYTAGALIDGFPYARLNVGDKHVQVGRFGETRVLWSTAGPRSITLPLDGAGPWVAVDVVGRVRELPAGTGMARLRVTDSPVYVLPRGEYERLTAFADP